MYRGRTQGGPGVCGHISAYGGPFRTRGGSFRPGRGLEVTGYGGVTGGTWGVCRGGPWGASDAPVYLPFLRVHGGSRGPLGGPGGPWWVRKRQIYKLARACSTVSPPPLVRFARGGSRFDRGGVKQPLPGRGPAGPRRGSLGGSPGPGRPFSGVTCPLAPMPWPWAVARD